MPIAEVHFSFIDFKVCERSLRKRRTKFGANFGTKQGLNIGNGFVYLSLKKCRKTLWLLSRCGVFTCAEYESGILFPIWVGHLHKHQDMSTFTTKMSTLHIITENAK